MLQPSCEKENPVMISASPCDIVIIWSWNITFQVLMLKEHYFAKENEFSFLTFEVPDQMIFLVIIAIIKI